MTRPRSFRIDPDPTRARGMPGAVYGDPAWYALQIERVFATSWHLAPTERRAPSAGAVLPFRLLPGSLDEPLLLARSRDGDALRALSNVCTHRGMLLVDGTDEQEGPTIRCPYHGRCFGLDGRIEKAPEFDDAHDFPTEADDLPRAKLGTWREFAFVGLHPDTAFDAWIAPVEERLSFWPPAEPRASTSEVYEVDAHWALYVENYLEGLHIPWVHPGLAREVDFRSYRVETFDRAVLQTAFARDGHGPVFDLPTGHPDHGRRVAAYYWWLHPTTMLNFYPWGLSVNRVEPLGPTRTRITFHSWIVDDQLAEVGAGAGLDQVEHEDEEAVQRVQLAVRSRLYRPGRLAPRHEAGVHRFHRLLAEQLCDQSIHESVIDL